MDFVERLFKVAPDGGDGTLELALTLAAIVALAILYWVFRHSSWRSHPDK